MSRDVCESKKHGKTRSRMTWDSFCFLYFVVAAAAICEEKRLEKKMNKTKLRCKVKSRGSFRSGRNLAYLNQNTNCAHCAWTQLEFLAERDVSKIIIRILLNNQCDKNTFQYKNTLWNSSLTLCFFFTILVDLKLESIFDYSKLIQYYLIM